MDELGEAVRDFLAWDNICGRVTELNLGPQQETQAKTRRDHAADATRSRVSATYIWAMVPEQQDPARPAGWQVIKAEGSQEHVADRVSAKLRQGGLLATAYGARNVRMDLDGPLKTIWEQGSISVGDLWAYYCRYPYLTRLRDRRVLDDAISSVLHEMMWETEGFALAEAVDSSSSDYRGLALPHQDGFGEITSSTLLVIPELATRQRAAELAERAKTDPQLGERETPPYVAGTDESPVALADQEPATQPTRFYATYRLDPERYSRDMNRVSQEILQHLAAESDVELEVSIEIQAKAPGGFSDERIRTVSENAKVLKLNPFGFEEK